MDYKTRRRLLRRISAIAAIAVAVVLFYPTEQTVAPRWEVTVVDDKGVRLAGVNVRETWQHASVEEKAHEEVVKTDKAGRVAFPKRTIKTSLISRASGCWYQRRQHQDESACGPRSNIWAFGPGLGPMDADDVNQTSGLYIIREFQPDLVVEQQTSMIMLHHCPPGRSGTGCKISESYR